MWAIRVFVLLCTVFAPNIQGQTFGTLYQPREYLTAVVDALWVKIKEYGLSNLPVLDTTFMYNYTGFGIELVGPISFEDGFVQDIDSVILSPLNFANGAPMDRAWVSGRISFENLRVYTDLHADIATGLKIGSVVFTPTTFLYDISVTQLHGNETVVPVVSFSSYTTLQWNVNPDDTETNLIRRQVLNQTNLWTPIGETRPDILLTTAHGWAPMLTEFVNEITASMDFPTVTF